MPRIVHTFRDYSAETDEDTPSASSDDDDDEENGGDENLFDSPPKRFKLTPRASRKYDSTPVLINISQNSSTMDECEVPRILRCIVDGKIKKFKKDSRAWLHKSSAKCTGNPRATCFTCHQSVLYFGPSNVEVECAQQHEKDAVKMELDKEMPADDRPVHGEKSVIHPKRGTETDVPATLQESTRTEIDMSCKNSMNSLIPETGSRISQLADSDADITYSEESQCPGLTAGDCDSNIDCSYIRRLSPLDSDSDTSLMGDMLELTRRNELYDECSRTRDEPDVDYTRLVPKRSENGIDISDDSDVVIEYEEITSKLAPAIEIEKESFKENLLDYAVNLFGKQLSEQSRLYSKKAHRRCRKTNSAGVTSQTTDNPSWSPVCACSLEKQHPDEGSSGSRQEQLVRLFTQTAYVDESRLEDMDCDENTNLPGNKTCNGNQNCGAAMSTRPNRAPASPPDQVHTLLVTAGRALFASLDNTIEDSPDDQ